MQPNGLGGPGGPPPVGGVGGQPPPMYTGPSQRRKDEDNLKLLTIFHYIVGGVTALFSLFPLLHVCIGLFFVFFPERLEPEDQAMPAFVGWLFVLLGGMFVLVGEAVAVLTIISGRMLSRRRRYLFSFIMACVMCIFPPFGTALGVFTIVVLSRQSVKDIYAEVEAEA